MGRDGDQRKRAQALADKIVKVADGIRRAADPPLPSRARITPTRNQGELRILSPTEDTLDEALRRASNALRDFAAEIDQLRNDGAK